MVLFVKAVSKVATPANLQLASAIVVRRQICTTSYLSSIDNARRKECESQSNVLVASVRHSGTIANVNELEGVTPENMKFQSRSVGIQTCGQLYEKWRTKKSWYKKAPKEGLRYDVEYVDTKELNPLTHDPNAPVVVALHGSPGTFGDFNPLMRDLMDKARIIAPNFPDYSLTERTGIYRHSAEEKKEVLKDFLKAIDVPRIDMLVMHSSSCYPSLLLWQDEEGPEIRSMSLISSPGHRRIKSMKPAWYIDNSVRLYLRPWGRALYRKVAPIVFRAMNVAVKIENVDNVLIAATAMMFSGNYRLASQFAQIRDEKIPTLFAFSEDDRLIEAKIFYELAEMLGAKEEHFERFDAKGTMTKKYESNDWLKVMAFKTGGHYTLLKHSAKVNAAIGQLLDQVALNGKAIPDDQVGVKARQLEDFESRHRKQRIVQG